MEKRERERERSSSWLTVAHRPESHVSFPIEWGSAIVFTQLLGWEQTWTFLTASHTHSHTHSMCESEPHHVITRRRETRRELVSSLFSSVRCLVNVRAECEPTELCVPMVHKTGAFTVEAWIRVVVLPVRGNSAICCRWHVSTHTVHYFWYSSDQAWAGHFLLCPEGQDRVGRLQQILKQTRTYCHTLPLVMTIYGYDYILHVRSILVSKQEVNVITED